MSAVGRPYQVSTIGSMAARRSHLPAFGRKALIETSRHPGTDVVCGITTRARPDTATAISSPAATFAIQSGSPSRKR